MQYDAPFGKMQWQPMNLALERSVNAAPTILLNAHKASHSSALHRNYLSCLDEVFWRAELRDAVLMDRMNRVHQSAKRLGDDLG